MLLNQSDLPQVNEAILEATLLGGVRRSMGLAAE